MKLADPAVILSSFADEIIFCRAFNWPMRPVDLVALPKSINSPFVKGRLEVNVK